jgi:hypothetical protein
VEHAGVASPGFATSQQQTIVASENLTSDLTRLGIGIMVGFFMIGLNVWPEQRVAGLVTMYQTTPRHDQQHNNI